LVQAKVNCNQEIIFGRLQFSLLPIFAAVLNYFDPALSVLAAMCNFELICVQSGTDAQFFSRIMRCEFGFREPNVLSSQKRAAIEVLAGNTSWGAFPMKRNKDHLQKDQFSRCAGYLLIHQHTAYWGD
jgi:hypothetical protein